MNRIRWALDGTMGYRIPSSMSYWIQLSSDDKLRLDVPTKTATIDSAFSSLGGNERLALVFPEDLYIERILLTVSSASTVYVETAPSTTNGVDGSWTSVSLTPGAYKPTVVNLNVAARGLRIRAVAGYWPICLAVYGEYSSSLAELWNEAGTSKLALTDLAGPNNTSFNMRIPFRIKNVTDTARNLRARVTKLKYTADALLSKFTFKPQGSTTAAPSYTAQGLLPGSLSEVVVLDVNLPSHSNPGDGLHEFTVVIEEV